ncbi:MAG: hypothetical protein M3237_13455 [Actinomycetota bacterium]|nr:hypothetical protein [Actinomycetota bacterium]
MKRALVAVLVCTVLAGCGGEDDPFGAYCDEVEEQQKPLTETLSNTTPTALMEALPSFEALAAKAPDDIGDEWSTLTDAIEGLVETLDEAGVDPDTYDRDEPPADVTEEEQTAIDAAARRLTAPETALALEAVQQQARDVCKTPLYL